MGGTRAPTTTHTGAPHHTYRHGVTLHCRFITRASCLFSCLRAFLGYARTGAYTPPALPAKLRTAWRPPPPRARAHRRSHLTGYGDTCAPPASLLRAYHHPAAASLRASPPPSLGAGGRAVLTLQHRATNGRAALPRRWRRHAWLAGQRVGSSATCRGGRRALPQRSRTSAYTPLLAPTMVRYRPTCEHTLLPHARRGTPMHTRDVDGRHTLLLLCLTLQYLPLLSIPLWLVGSCVRRAFYLPVRRWFA